LQANPLRGIACQSENATPETVLPKPVTHKKLG